MGTKTLKGVDAIREGERQARVAELERELAAARAGSQRPNPPPATAELDEAASRAIDTLAIAMLEAADRLGGMEHVGRVMELAMGRMAVAQQRIEALPAVERIIIASTMTGGPSAPDAP